MTFGKSLLKTLAGRRGNVIGLDIGSGTIKMAEVSLSGSRAALKRLAVMDLPAGTIEDGVIHDEKLLADTIQRMAAKNGFSGSQVAVALGGRSLFIREVSFPRMSEAEMRQAIRWDLAKYVPFDPEQLYFDFWIVGPGATDVEVRVLLVAAPKEVVDAVIRVLAKAGLKLAVIDIEPLAIERTLPETPDCMVIDCGATFSQVTLFQKESPVFTRNIPIGGNQFTSVVMESMEVGRDEAERIKQGGEGILRTGTGAEVMTAQIDRIVGELAGEVRRTLEYYQVQNREVNITSVFLTGGGAKIAALAEKLSSILELPVILHDPLANMEVASSFNREYLRGVGPQMSVAVGLAMRGGE